MTTAVSSPSDARLWIGVLAAPLAWVAAEMVGFVASSRLCQTRTGFSSADARVVNVIICSVCLAVALTGLVVAVGNYRRTRHLPPHVTFDRAAFMSIGGVFTSAVFAAAIVLFAVPALIVNVCNQAR